jgi:hypothetical protein
MWKFTTTAVILTYLVMNLSAVHAQDSIANIFYEQSSMVLTNVTIHFAPDQTVNFNTYSGSRRPRLLTGSGLAATSLSKRINFASLKYFEHESATLRGRPPRHRGSALVMAQAASSTGNGAKTAKIIAGLAMVGVGSYLIATSGGAFRGRSISGGPLGIDVDIECKRGAEPGSLGDCTLWELRAPGIGLVTAGASVLTCAWSC